MKKVELWSGDKWVETGAKPKIIKEANGLVESKKADGDYYHDKDGQLIYRIREEKIALFPTISNPPTFGTVHLLLKIAEKYDKIVVLVYNKPGIMLTVDVVNRLGYVLTQLSDKFTIVSSDADFSNINYLPKLAENSDIVTTSTTIYTNLASKGYKHLLLVEPMMGYNESYHRIAYSRSLILERLRQAIRVRR